MKITTTLFNIKIFNISISGLFKLMRPHQWIKNLFIFVPLFFAGEILNSYKLLTASFGFLSFSLIASCIYILNDLKDVEVDRIHPVKKFRPLAIGEVNKTQSIILACLLFIGGFLIASQLDVKFAFILLLYFILNLSYSIGLKNISILDVILVSIGFVLRVRAGGALVNVHVSAWLTIMVFLLALFLAFAKRRDDVVLQMKSGKDLRKVSKDYNLDFLTVATTLIVSISLVAYLMYCISPLTNEQFGTHRLYHTFLFVLAGVLRYLQITFVKNDSGSPTKILYQDRFIHVVIFLWLISFAFIIYFPDFSLFDQYR
jgi:decaprenyl-phosphate phosphoribosyltransferase